MYATVQMRTLALILQGTKNKRPCLSGRVVFRRKSLIWQKIFVWTEYFSSTSRIGLIQRSIFIVEIYVQYTNNEHRYATIFFTAYS